MGFVEKYGLNQYMQKSACLKSKSVNSCGHLSKLDLISNNKHLKTDSNRNIHFCGAGSVYSLLWIEVH